MYKYHQCFYISSTHIICGGIALHSNPSIFATFADIENVTLQADTLVLYQKNGEILSISGCNHPNEWFREVSSILKKTPHDVPQPFRRMPGK